MIDEYKVILGKNLSQDLIIYLKEQEMACTAQYSTLDPSTPDKCNIFLL